MNKLILPALLLAAWTAQAQPSGDRYARLFQLPQVEWNAEQQEKVAALREKYEPRLKKLDESRRGLMKPDQARARQKAFREAVDAGKSREEARRLGEAATGHSDAQTKQMAELQAAWGTLMRELRTELLGLATPEQRGNRPAARPPARRGAPPTHADLKYGPAARNVMDVWLAESDAPAPVVVAIHGGGFRGGNKSVDAGLRAACLEAGISVVAITYRLTGEVIAPAQHHDCARAIQFIRHNGKTWNIDPQRIISTGGSAGAGLSLWLGMHDDLADPDHENPVLRESTRLSGMVVYNGQTSYDPRFIRELFPENDTYQHSALAQLYDVDLDQLDAVSDEKKKLFEYVSALPHLTKDDAPALLIYGSRMDAKVTNQGVGIHHPRFGKVLKEKMDPLNIDCTVLPGVRRGSEEWIAANMAFFKKHLGLAN